MIDFRRYFAVCATPVIDAVMLLLCCAPRVVGRYFSRHASRHDERRGVREMRSDAMMLSRLLHSAAFATLFHFFFFFHAACSFASPPLSIFSGFDAAFAAGFAFTPASPPLPSSMPDAMPSPCLMMLLRCLAAPFFATLRAADDAISCHTPFRVATFATYGDHHTAYTSSRHREWLSRIHNILRY